MLLGLTGGYCAGKNLAVELLARSGIPSIDVDKAGHEALAERGADIAAAFGPSCLRPDGSPDRAALARIVFSDRKALLRLEAIVHPAMFAIVDRFVASRGDRDACVNAAILYRMPVAARCDAIIEIRAGLGVRLDRARRRDGATALSALTRIFAQSPLAKARRRHSGKVIVVRNDAGSDELERSLLVAIERARRLARPARDAEKPT